MSILVRCHLISGVKVAWKKDLFLGKERLSVKESGLYSRAPLCSAIIYRAVVFRWLV